MILPAYHDATAGKIALFLVFFVVFTIAFILWVDWYVQRNREDLDKQRVELGKAISNLGDEFRKAYEPLALGILTRLNRLLAWVNRRLKGPAERR